MFFNAKSSDERKHRTMKSRKWSIRILVRYSLLQLPAIILLIFALQFIQKSKQNNHWVFWIILLLWVVKDIALYPFVWRAYDANNNKKLQSLLGITGIVVKSLNPSGWIQVQGELWQAEANKKGLIIDRGETVIIEKVIGLKLFVRIYEE